MTTLRKEIEAIIDDCKSTEYSWNGEDEVPYDYTDSYEASNRIIQLLTEKMKTYSNEERLNYAKSVASSKGETFIHESVRIGQNCSIGGDGFGYAREADGTLIKMPHRGDVVIEENVEIGSNSCIDRAVVGSTVIGAGTKIDNNVHIAHGVKIGKNCLIVAGAVIGGSCEIGDNCFIGINASIKNKVKVGNNVTVGMGAVVLKDVSDGATVVGNPGRIL